MVRYDTPGLRRWEEIDAIGAGLQHRTSGRVRLSFHLSGEADRISLARVLRVTSAPGLFDRSTPVSCTGFSRMGLSPVLRGRAR